MIDIKRVLQLHHRSLKEHGGGQGIRDENLLLAALGRAFQTFDQQDLYPTPIEKATAIFESLIINHPFIDANKRTAYVTLRLMLFLYGLDVMASDEEKISMTLAASIGEIRFDEIKQWIEDHLVSIDK